MKRGERTMANSTLRMLMPQWQGGNNEAGYALGAELLSWLAPKSDDPLVEVPIESDPELLKTEEGVVARQALLKQLQSAEHLIEQHQPDNIVIFGGDCLVGQAPYAYLNERYGGDVGVLWIDSHGDISSPKEMENANTMVLGNLLGEGNQAFADKVKMPLKPQNVMLAGIKPKDYEAERIEALGIQVAYPEDFEGDSDIVIKWINDNSIRHLIVHFDVDILDPNRFRSQIFASPEPISINWAEGEMNLGQIGRLIDDVSKHTSVVGLGITEHMPWDANALRHLLSNLPLLKNE